MRNTLAIMLNSLKVTFRKRSNILVYLIVPLISVVLIMGFISGGKEGKIKIGVVNNDNNIISNDMMKYLKDTGKFEVINITQSQVEKSIVDKDVALALVIPKDFTEGIYKNKVDNIKIVSIQGKEVTAWIENYTNRYIDNLLSISKVSKGNKDEFDKIYNNYKKEGTKLNVKKLEDKRENKELTERGLGMIMMFVLMGATSTSSIILKDKKDKVYERICSTPVSSKSYMFGNMLANFSIITVQNLSAILSIKYILNIDMYIPFYKLFFIMELFGVVSVAISIIVVAFSDSTAAAGYLSSLIITPTCMLGGCFWSLDFTSDKIRKLSNFVPQKWAIEGISKLQNGASFYDIRMNILILIAFALTLFSIATFKMKSSTKTGDFI